MLDREGREAEEVLARARGVVDPAIREAVASLPRVMGRVAAYHLGWQDADGRDVAGDTGKALRPALVLAAVRAFGGSPESAAHAAAAVELVHNFTLLHDDVIDRDPTRRHRPTAWSVFGTSDAILAGDALQALALGLFARDPHPAAAAAHARLSACVIELCEGQHADCSFEVRQDVTLAECLAMAEAKTGALLGCACAVGALYAGAGGEAADDMDAFGRQMGLAFQLIDDLIGIWGDPEVTGKPAGADLAARKKSLPVVAAWSAGGRPAADLAALYGSGRAMTDDDVREAAEAVARGGGRVWAQSEAGERMAAALEHLGSALPGCDADAADDLLVLAELVTRRDH